MTTVFIYFSQHDWKSNRYNNELMSAIRAKHPDWILFDFDSQSDSMQVHYFEQLVQSSDHLILVLNLLETGETGILVKVLNQMSRIRDKKVQIYYQGSNAKVNKMLQLLNAKDNSGKMMDIV